MQATVKARTKRLEIVVSEEEMRRIQMVGADMGVRVSQWLRPLILAEVDREYQSRGLNRRRRRA